MALDGSSVRRVTEGGDFYVPAWAPDGETIAFRSSSGVGKTVGLVMTEGGSPVPLTGNDESAELVRPVHWSADGQRLTYAGKDDDGSIKVWEISRAGGQRRQLIPTTAHLQHVAEWAWGAETKLLYALWSGPGKTDVWIVDSSTSAAPINLTNARVAGLSYPRWSPDGARIAFVGFPLASDGSIEGLGSHSQGAPQVPDAEIFVIDANDGELQRITDNTFEESGLAWSPDGESLIVTSNADGDNDLWLVPLAAPNEARNLIDDSDSPADDTTPDWYWGSD